MKFPLDFEDFNPGCTVAAAILGAGAIGAGASIWGANKAADAQTNAANASIANQQQTRTMNQNLLQPFINAGQGGISGLQDWLNPSSSTGGLFGLKNWLDPSGGASGSNPLSALIKLTTPGANMTETLSQTPGYQFAEDKGLRAVNNQLAARGLGGSPGAVSKGAGDYVTGLANNTWQSVVNALQGVFTSGAGGMQNLFTSGAGALQNLVNTGVNAGGAVAGSNTAAGNNISSNLIGIGNAQGGAATATGQAIGGLGNSVSTAAILRQLLGGGAGGASGPAYGGDNGIYGGSSQAPLPGLTAADYGIGF